MNYSLMFQLLAVLFILLLSGTGGGIASEDEKSLEFKLTDKCQKEYKAQVADCKTTNADDKDKRSGLLESCLGEAKDILKECMDTAKAKAQSEADKDKKGREKEDLLKRWTY